jgi:hypothetical protein
VDAGVGDKFLLTMKNSEIERYYFEMFQKDCRLPEGVVECGDKPDVVIRGERSIGIEITNFFLADGASSESEQVQRRARAQVVSKAQSIYQEDGNDGLGLVLGFDRAVPIRDQNQLAGRIADLAVHLEGQQSGEIRRDRLRGIPELSFAWLIAEKHEQVLWRNDQVNSTPKMSLERLQEIIKDKESKSRHYRPCSAYWLLVVVDCIDPAQDQEVRIDGFDTVHSDVFEKVLVYKTAFGHILETKCGQQCRQCKMF